MKIHPTAKKLSLRSSKIGYPLTVGHEMLSFKLSKDMSKRCKAENKTEKRK